MESQRSIERQYSVLLKRVANDDFYKIDLTNRVNCYTCTHPKCAHVTKTIDIDAGVTPMFFACEDCGNRAISSGYRNTHPDLKPTIEWYRPTLSQVLKMRKNPALVEHILQGGLSNRKINLTAAAKRE